MRAPETTPVWTSAGDREDSRAGRFRALALPHLDEVYTLARYLLGHAADAEDATQECFLRALRHFDTYRGPEIRPWLFAILRNVCHGLRRPKLEMTADVEEDENAAPLWREAADTPEGAVLRRHDAETVRRLIAALPDAYREVLVLREVHDLSYREIAAVAEVPVGTVMSRLARARAELRTQWLASEGEEPR